MVSPGSEEEEEEEEEEGVWGSGDCSSTLQFCHFGPKCLRIGPVRCSPAQECSSPKMLVQLGSSPVLGVGEEKILETNP